MFLCMEQVRVGEHKLIGDARHGICGVTQCGGCCGVGRDEHVDVGRSGKECMLRPVPDMAAQDMLNSLRGGT